MGEFYEVGVDNDDKYIWLISLNYYCRLSTILLIE